jgi:hypothetical protein
MYSTRGKTESPSDPLQEGRRKTLHVLSNREDGKPFMSSPTGKTENPSCTLQEGRRKTLQVLSKREDGKPFMYSPRGKMENPLVLSNREAVKPFTFLRERRGQTSNHSRLKPKDKMSPLGKTTSSHPSLILSRVADVKHSSPPIGKTSNNGPLPQCKK